MPIILAAKICVRSIMPSTCSVTWLWVALSVRDLSSKELNYSISTAVLESSRGNVLPIKRSLDGAASDGASDGDCSERGAECGCRLLTGRR